MPKWIAVLVLVGAWMFPAKCRGDEIVKAYAGVNGIWFDSAAPSVYPSDFELGGTLRASLSPHLSLVGGAWYGIEHSYIRGSIGARVTATDVEDRNFSVGFGIQRHASSEPSVRPEEWAPDASVGWKPYPYQMPRVVLVAQGSYGLTSGQASALAGVRYEIGGGR